MPKQPTRYVFTTLRYDGILTSATENGSQPSCVYLLKDHFDRLSEAAVALFGARGRSILIQSGLTDTRTLEAVVDSFLRQDGTEQTACYRVRLQVDEQGKTTITAATIPRLSATSLFPRTLDMPSDSPAPAWDVVLDVHATEPSNATRYKTDDRTDYDRARSDAGIQDFAATREVLLYDTSGDILDASITTPYFYRHKQWVTPAASCGGQQGTTRRWALSQGLCTESVVNLVSLEPDERIWLSNAARGFFPAIFRHTPKHT